MSHSNSFNTTITATNSAMNIIYHATQHSIVWYSCLRFIYYLSFIQHNVDNGE